ncbi:GspH/FimT family pseudopilin [Desulfosoma caldarium]|uniref:Type II secretion system protein H n=1 Tax=Desulfosoma caldarium TaxID=610254 RepID=A0A3N1VGE6_9BACT|nr:GspH/FimT family protein [Desulfosoma caldarium]ROR01933.1 prepilin-type N-terminal cleavage/methylation domain-containing protein [Desulfosoma caldarium]
MGGMGCGAARWDRAMTLVELMVVLGLMALLLTLISVHIHSASYRLKSAVSTLRTLIQRARLEAVRTNKNTYLDFDADDDGIMASVVLWVSMDSRESSPSLNEGKDRVLISQALVNPPGSSGNRPTLGAVPASAGGPSVGAPRDGGSIPEDGVSFSGNRINFNPDGTSSTGSVYIHVPKHPEVGTYAIVLNNSGRAYVRYYPTGGTAWEDR